MSKSIIYRSGILLFVSLIPVVQNVSSGMLVALFIFSFAMPGPEKSTEYLLQAWDLWLYLLMLAIGLIYTEDLSTGLRVMETSLTFLVLPFVMVKLEAFDKKYLFAIFFAFTAGLFTASLVCLGYAGVRYSQDAEISVFFQDQLVVPLVNTHPIYFAYYLIFAITFGLYLIYYNESVLPRWAIILLLNFFFVVLLLMGSNTAMLSIVFSLLYFILKFYFEEKRPLEKRVAFAWASSFLICLLVVNSQDMKLYGVSPDVYWERFVLWESAVNALPNWLIGVGTGDDTLVLNHYYSEHNLSEFAVSNFNPHNQFIATLLCTGIAGFLTVVTLMSRPIYGSIRNQSIIGFLTMFPFLVYGTTEVFLGRYQGVVFFVLLHQTFTLFYRRQESLSSVKDN
jgi:O-antigen ligase